MVVREKISGALYADAVLGEEENFDPDALALLTYLAGLVVDRLASRKLKPAPALRVPEPVKKPEPAGMWMNEEAAAVEELSAVGGSRRRSRSRPPPTAPARRPSARRRRPRRSVDARDPDAGALAPARRAARGGRVGRRAAGGGAPFRAAARLGDQALQRARGPRGARGRKPLPAPARTTSTAAARCTTNGFPTTSASSTNFFQEELVRILADGRPEALGV